MSRNRTLLPSFRLLWLIGTAILYGILAYAVPRSEFGLLLGLLAGLFCGYGWIGQTKRLWTTGDDVSIDGFLFGSAVFFRLILLFAMPQLSDDVYRFVWDGRLLAHGYNPYLYLPGHLLNTPIAAHCGLTESLFRQLNSPGYFTVYPPVNQALFGLAAWLSPNSLLGNVVWLRVPIVGAEIGSLWLMVGLLRRFGLSPNLALRYGLNPLVILELTGNLHFEAVMLFFTLLATRLLLNRCRVASAGALAMAIGTKLLPLLLLPLLVRRLGWRMGLGYALLTGGMTAALFVPFASLELARNLFSSLALYFQKFEFNASVYYVLRAAGYWIKGYNAIERIGFWLSVTTTVSILWIAFRWRTTPAPVLIITTLTLYFAFATTVHPWYVTTLVAASVFARFRYPVVWSGLIPLSYFTYANHPYHENLWLTALEYGIVLILGLTEWRLYRRATGCGLAKPGPNSA